MTVRLTSPVLGLDVGAAYTGTLESWLIAEGYATTATSVPDAWTPDSDGILGAKAPVTSYAATAAVLTGASNAANLTASGTVVFGTKGGASTSVSLASGDTPSAAAAKIDTALSGKADAAISSSKLQITSTATGPSAYVTVVSGTQSILDKLGLSVDQSARGGDGKPVGVSPLGAQADTPAKDPTAAANRDEKPYWPASDDRNATIANDATNLTKVKFPAPGFDFDAAGVDDDAPSNVVLSPVTGPAAGGTVVTITGDNLEGVTSVTFGGTAGTALDVSDAADGIISVTTPPKTAGAVTVVLVDASGNRTINNGFTFTA